MPNELKLSADAIGNLIGVSGRRVRQLVDEGRIPAPVAGKFDAGQVVRRIIAAASDARPDPEREARAGLLRAKARAAVMKNDRDAGKLVTRDEANSSIDFICGLVNSELSGFAARVTRDRTMRAKLEDEIFALRERLAEGVGQAAAILDGDNPPEPDDEEGPAS